MQDGLCVPPVTEAGRVPCLFSPAGGNLQKHRLLFFTKDQQAVKAVLLYDKVLPSGRTWAIRIVIQGFLQKSVERSKNAGAKTVL